MNTWSRPARVNVRVLVILVTVLVVAGAALMAARQIRRGMHSQAALTTGLAAYDGKDWLTATRNLRAYLALNPDDLEVLRKYSAAALAVRPLDLRTVSSVIAAYRRIARLDPRDRAVDERLVLLCTAIGQYEEIISVARTRLEEDSQDCKASLWLADALAHSGKTTEAQQTLRGLLDRLDGPPERPAEYVQACLRLSRLAEDEAAAAPGPAGGEDPNRSTGSPTPGTASANAVTPLTWLDKAVNYAPRSVEARVYRARLCRRLAETAEAGEEDAATLLELAHQDLQAADTAGTEDPQLRCLLGVEWMALGELDRASAELEAAAQAPPEAVADRFLDLADWTAAKFLLAAELAVQKGAAAQAAPLADEALACLPEKRHRVQILPPAIQLYVAARKTVEARRCLDEYLSLAQAQQPSAETSTGLALLSALVAWAEGRPQAVIDALEPLVRAGNTAERRIPWPFLVEACNQTNQPGRAVNLLLQGLQRAPQDVRLRERLAEQYAALGDWDKTLAAATLAEAGDPKNRDVKLLRLRAAVNLAVKQAGQVDVPRLQELDKELAELRQASPEAVGVRVLQAIVDDHLQRPDEAEQELQRAVQECQEPRQAEMQLARHYQQLGRKAEALAVCQTACERAPSQVENWLAGAELSLADGDPNAARRYLNQGLGAVTGAVGKHALTIRLAVVDLTYGNRAAGLERLRALAARDPQEAQARLLLLETREIQADPAAAQKLVAELRQVEGEGGLWWRLHQAALWLSSADWAARQQDIRNLLQYCRNADPTWSAPVLLWAGLYEKLGDSGQVEETYRAGLLQNPAAEDLANRLLSLLEKQGRLAEAEKVVQQIDKSRGIADAWQVRLAIGTGDLSRAIDLLRLKASNDNQDALSRVRLAELVYRQTKDVKRAFAYLTEAETLAANVQSVVATKAYILRAEGRKEELRRVLDDHVARHPGFEALHLRAAYLAREGDMTQAEADYRRLAGAAEGGTLGYLFLGNFYADQRALDPAIAAFEEGLHRYPDDTRLQSSLMQLLLRRDRPEDRSRALRLLTALEARLPQDPELTALRALQMVRDPAAPSLTEVRQKLEAAVKRDPAAVRAHLALIAIARRERDYRAACDYAIRGLESNSNQPALLAARSRAELLLGYTPMAVKLAQTALQQDPNNLEALNVLIQGAEATADRKLLNEARSLIDSAAGRNPGEEQFLLAKARVLTALEQPQEAIPVLQAYCQAHGEKAGMAVLVTLADLYRVTGDFPGAETWIAQAERRGTGSQAVVHARCLWLAAQNRWNELMNISAAYVGAKDQDLNLLLSAATLLLTSKSPPLISESVKLFEHTAKVFPTSLDANLGWASLLYQTGDGQRAKKIYQELRQRAPNNVRVLNDLAWILQEQDHQYEAALDLANRGLRLAPDDVHLLDTRATILANMPNRLAEARTDFTRLAELLPAQTREKARALGRLGRICLQLKDPAQAKQYLQSALAIDRETPVFTADERLEITKALQESGA